MEKEGETLGDSEASGGLFVARLAAGTSIAEASRIERGKVTWPPANSSD